MRAKKSFFLAPKLGATLSSTATIPPARRRRPNLHAVLHDDEWPGELTPNHLIGMLEESNAKVNFSGEIVPQPVSNPGGNTHQLNGYFAGRNAFDCSGNFDRNWPDLAVKVVKHLDKHAW